MTLRNMTRLTFVCCWRGDGEHFFQSCNVKIHDSLSCTPVRDVKVEYVSLYCCYLYVVEFRRDLKYFLIVLCFAFTVILSWFGIRGLKVKYGPHFLFVCFSKCDRRNTCPRSSTVLVTVELWRRCLVIFATCCDVVSHPSCASPLLCVNRKPIL